LPTANRSGSASSPGARIWLRSNTPTCLSVGLRISKLGSGSVVWETGLVRVEDELEVAEGRFVHVFVDRVTRRPRHIEQSARAAMASLLAGTGSDGL
jgi:acyl-CoA thioester hydrolase